MRALAILAALALVTAPVLVAPSVAYADGIERQRPRPRPATRRTAPPPPAPPAIIEEGPETVSLPESFFESSSGGVGAEVGLESSYYHSNNTVIIRGDRRGGRGRRHACFGCR